MELIVRNYLSSLELGDMLVFGNMATIPLFIKADMEPDYITLDEALQHHLSQITEISESGSVPELKVINHADMPLLLIDGEELLGARQNRILNATILVKERAETVIPVSCCEQGRWHHTSRNFSTSPHIMPCFLRQAKVGDVTTSLRSKKGYRSNQARVWDQLRESALRFNVDSPTGAMKDLFDAKEEELHESLKALEIKPEQKGVLIFINGEVAGLDIVSRGSAYMTLHPKLIKSYAIESLEKRRMRTKPSVEKARAFLAEAAHCVEEKYPSIGYGWNYRYEGERVVGAALVYQDRVIHASFFRTRRIDSNGLSDFQT